MAIVFWNVASCSVYHHPWINLNLLVLVKGSHKHFKILRKIVGRNCSEYREQDIGWHNGSVYLSNVIIDKSASRTPQIQPRWA